MKPLLIAEVKTRSPYGWRSNKSWRELFDIAGRRGGMISVHTDPRWGGSFEKLAEARRLTTKPLLAKGIHASDADIEQAVAAGADWVLVVGRAPRVHATKCLIEVESLSQLAGLDPSTRVVWNARDLATGKPKIETFTQARKLWPGWLCQASYIKTKSDIQPGADAILVGTHLPEFVA